MGDAGSYVFARELGRGAVGHVWSANRKRDGLPVAVKIVDPRPDLLTPSVFPDVMRRFEREAVNGLALSHDAVVRLLDRGQFRDRPFIVMELATGNVSEQVKATSGLGWKPAAAILRRVVGALEYMHAQGCIHRDIKPDNLLLLPRGVVVGDLGIVKWSDLNPAFVSAGTMTRASIQLGSWYYMAPEQRRSPHEAMEASDVYALGVTWYELMMGQTPPPEAFAARDVPLADAPSRVNLLVMSMTAYRPEDRPSVADLVSSLDGKLASN